MDRCTQFSFFLVNKPGVLTRIFSELAKAKVNVTAMAMMDSMEHGVLRMVVDDVAAARPVLSQLNFQFTESELLCVTLPNRPGAAADLCERLATKHINIGYMYCTGPSRGGKTLVMVKVPDINKALKALDGAAKGTRKDMKVKLRRPKARTKR